MQYREMLETIRNFLLAIATRSLALRGVFLERLIHRGIDWSQQPTCQATAELVPQEILTLAREWQKRPDEVMARLEAERA